MKKSNSDSSYLNAFLKLFIPRFVFLLFLISVALIIPAMSSEFGLGSRTDNAIKNFYVNNTFISIANGSDVFVYRAGDTMTGRLNVSADVNISQNLYVGGNVSMKRPYAMIADNTTQVIPNANNAYGVNFSIIEDNYLINVYNRQNISFLLSGDYLIEISALFTVTTGTNKHVYIWLRKNGVDIARSNTQVEIPNANVETVVAVPFIIDINPGDNITIIWGSDTTAAQLLNLNAGTNPTRPEVPSIIATISKISEITP